MIKSWVKKHIVAIAIAVLSALLGVVYWLPAQASWFIGQRLAKALGFLAHGALIFLPVFIPRLDELPGLGVAVLALLGLMIGLAIEFLWKHGWPGKATVILSVLLNAAFGLFFVLATDVLVGRPYAECERMVSQTNGVRIVAYPEIGFLPGGHFFFLATRDSGESWQQIMDFRHDDPVDPPCENIRSRGADQY